MEGGPAEEQEHREERGERRDVAPRVRALPPVTPAHGERRDHGEEDPVGPCHRDQRREGPAAHRCHRPRSFPGHERRQRQRHQRRPVERVLEPRRRPCHERRVERAEDEARGEDRAVAERDAFDDGHEEHVRDRDEARGHDLGRRGKVEGSGPVEEGQEPHPGGVREALDRRDAGLRREPVPRRELARVGDRNPGVVDEPAAVLARVERVERQGRGDGGDRRSPPQSPVSAVLASKIGKSGMDASIVCVGPPPASTMLVTTMHCLDTGSQTTRSPCTQFGSAHR